MKELSLHLLDLVENSVAAGATWVYLHIEEDAVADRLVISVADNGQGMSEEMAPRATDPFVTSRKTRKVGLGLALLSAAAEQAGGKLLLWSTPGQGTQVISEFVLSNIDRAPLGRIEDTLATIAALHPDLDLRFWHQGPLGAYSLELLELTAEFRPGRLRREIASRVRAGRQQIGSVA